ncbi:MAG: CDP-diacylglycerol--serine O-phosphatidyltransferase [Bacteroidia bacterium]
MVIKKHIPNFITCLNLFCGCASIVFSTQGMIALAAYLIFAAIIFDFIDGLAARTLKAYTEIGKQLDSLADMVSFGTAPAFILFYILDTQTVNYFHTSVQLATTPVFLYLLPFSSFLISIFSALRLAKFNIDPRQTVNFIGLPTPATAMFISSLAFIPGDDLFGGWVQNPYVLLVFIFMLSLLMVSNIPLFSMKVKNLKWKDNVHRFIFLVIALILIIILKFAAIPIIIILYVVLSLLLPWNKVEDNEV